MCLIHSFVQIQIQATTTSSLEILPVGELGIGSVQFEKIVLFLLPEPFFSLNTNFPASCNTINKHPPQKISELFAKSGQIKTLLENNFSE
jgi:hypothetical protein